MKPMRNVANKMFGLAAAGVMAMTPMAAFSQAAPANQNVTPVAASVQQVSVQFVDAQDRTMNDARFLAAAASTERVALVVWGGNRTIQQEAYNAARDLAGMGIPTAFVLGPDHNNLDGAAVMQVYAASTPRADGMWGIDNADQIRANMREQGLAAYREAFPAQLAQLSLR